MESSNNILNSKNDFKAVFLSIRYTKNQSVIQFIAFFGHFNNIQDLFDIGANTEAKDDNFKYSFVWTCKYNLRLINYNILKKVENHKMN